MNCLGLLYENGSGVKLDKKKAMKLLTFDEPASFSAAAAEYTPASRRGARPPAPEHELGAFFLAPGQETRSLVVVDCVCDTNRVVEAAGRFGAVLGVDDSRGARSKTPSHETADAATRQAATCASTPEARCHGAVFAPPTSVVISGLPLATAEQDVRHVFSANAYGDVAAVHKWRDQHRPESPRSQSDAWGLGLESRQDALAGAPSAAAAAGPTARPEPPRAALSARRRSALGAARATRRAAAGGPAPHARRGDARRLRPEQGAAGGDARTTLMVRNIPNKYTQKAVLEELDVKFANTYDFFYLPIDFKNKCNVGYAFINLVVSKDALRLFKEFNGRRWTCFRSGKVCAITYARIQGKQAMIQRFQNSSLLNESPTPSRGSSARTPEQGRAGALPGGAPVPTAAQQAAQAAAAANPPKDDGGGGNRRVAARRNARRPQPGGGANKG
ncbi:RNA binding-protein [Aureococcus anophagefferens]|nr:RNA binding-protein [Aureococcus anophagefferens]